MSFFVPSVHLGRSRPTDPDDPFSGRLPFGASRRRPKRKKTPIPWTCRIPYMCRILMVSLTGFLVLISGVTMSVFGYYPGYFAGESALNGTNVNVVQNKLMYYHIRNLAFVGPILMGTGCFAMIVAGVIYFEFRDKYFRDLPQDEIKTMTKKDVRNLLVDQFRYNYFRGIPIPPLESDEEVSENQKEAHVNEKIGEFQKVPNIRKGSSISVGNSLAPMVSRGLSELQRAHSTSTIPNMHPTVILSPLNLFHNNSKCNTPSVDEIKGSVPDKGSLVNMFRLAPSSLSGRTSTTGVENPAYLSDNDSEESQSDHCPSDTKQTILGQAKYLRGSPSPIEGRFTSVIVHAASIHFPPDHPDFCDDNGLQKSKSIQSASRSRGGTAVDHAAYKSCPSFKEAICKSVTSSQEMTNTDRKRRHRSLKANKSCHKKKIKNRKASSYGDILSSTNRQRRSDIPKSNGGHIQIAGDSHVGLSQCEDSVFSIGSLLQKEQRVSRSDLGSQINIVENTVSNTDPLLSNTEETELASIQCSSLANDIASVDSGFPQRGTKCHIRTHEDARSNINSDHTLC